MLRFTSSLDETSAAAEIQDDQNEDRHTSSVREDFVTSSLDLREIRYNDGLATYYSMY